ncbi:MAG: MFS transporter, partial [Bacteroidetes bacterium]|nr:MFS transporter [Bacteroidota bacterium]
SALLSGASLMLGGIISKSIINRPLTRKIPVAILVQLIASGAMIAVSQLHTSNLFTLLVFVVFLNMTSGFVFNNFFAWCLGRFSSNAGILSGLTGGGLFVLTSIISYSMVGTLGIRSQLMLGVAYLVLVVLHALAFLLFLRARSRAAQLSVE